MANPQPVNVHYSAFYGSNPQIYPAGPMYNGQQMKRSWVGVNPAPQYNPYVHNYSNGPMLNMSNPGIPLNRSMSAYPMPFPQQFPLA